jgi:hypothetical protein
MFGSTLDGNVLNKFEGGSDDVIGLVRRCCLCASPIGDVIVVAATFCSLATPSSLRALVT